MVLYITKKKQFQTQTHFENLLPIIHMYVGNFSCVYYEVELWKNIFKGGVLEKNICPVSKFACHTCQQKPVEKPAKHKENIVVALDVLRERICQDPFFENILIKTYL